MNWRSGAPFPHSHRSLFSCISTSFTCSWLAYLSAMVACVCVGAQKWCHCQYCSPFHLAVISFFFLLYNTSTSFWIADPLAPSLGNCLSLWPCFFLFRSFPNSPLTHSVKHTHTHGQTIQLTCWVGPELQAKRKAAVVSQSVGRSVSTGRLLDRSRERRKKVKKGRRNGKWTSTASARVKREIERESQPTMLNRQCNSGTILVLCCC